MQQPIPVNKTQWLYLFIGLAVLLNFSGLFIPIIGPDGTLYATIAKTMVQRNDYVQLFVHGTDWLDKPHFPFWITALSFKIFGFKTWAYKLPGILFMLMGAAYAFKLAKELYNKEIALWSVLILLTSQHIVLSNNDVRAEPYLTGLIIASVYHFYKAYTRNNFWPLIIGSLFAACAIMTKGMFALVPIGGAIVGELVIKKQWKQLFNLRWLLAAVLIGIFIVPEIYCLHKQFDVHPEKLVFDTHGVSGVKFFFWDSQFGRFFNTGPIKGHGDPTFFVHTTLWAFLPWSLLLFAAIWQFVKTGVKDVNKREWLCISGALLTFLLFSASKFQLPHYLNIVFPFFAIITSQYLVQLQSLQTLKIIRVLQTVVVLLLVLVVVVLQYTFDPVIRWDTALAIFIWTSLLIILPGNFAAGDFRRTAFRTLIAAFVINLYLNVVFYPALLKYQAGSEAAMWINNYNRQSLPVVEHLDVESHPFDFYINSQLIILQPGSKASVPSSSFIFYGTPAEVTQLASGGRNIQQLAQFARYRVTRLKPKFLNSKTRANELTYMQVILVGKN